MIQGRYQPKNLRDMLRPELHSSVILSINVSVSKHDAKGVEKAYSEGTSGYLRHMGMGGICIEFVSLVP
jgi:hypothetical protein